MGLHGLELSLEFLPDRFILNGLQFPNRPFRHFLRDFFQTAFHPGDLDFLLVLELVQLLLPPDFEFLSLGFQAGLLCFKIGNSPAKFIGVMRGFDLTGFEKCSRVAAIRTPASPGVPQSSIRWMRRPARAEAGRSAPAWLR